MAAVLVAAAVSGCATEDKRPRQTREPVCFPNARAVPRVVVYGGIGDLLPSWNDTPPLERFLYGPTPDQSAAGSLRNPQGLAWLGERLLVCDQGWPDVTAIDPATGRSRSFCGVHHPPRCPVDVATDGEGRVYVADTTTRAVLTYGPDGRFLDELRPATTAPESFRPCSVLVSGGVLYVGDLAGRRIERFDLSRRAWLSPFTPPAGAAALIAPTGIAAGPDGTLLIADAVTAVVHRATLDGRWLAPIGRPGRERGQFVRPKQVRGTRSGLIFVVDAGRQSVIVFDRHGKCLFEVAAVEDGWNGFALPMGLAVAPATEAASLSMRLGDAGQTPPDEYVIVSDTLGGVSLVVLGVVTEAGEGRPDAQ